MNNRHVDSIHHISNRLSYEQIDAYLSEHIFQLRPSEYATQYPDWPGAVGLELEMLPYRKGSDRPTLVPLQGHEKSLAAHLRQLAKEQGWTCEEDSGELLTKVILDQGDVLTFEPGGQLEISTIPYPCLASTVERLQNIQSLLRTFLAQHHIELLQTGINPWYSAGEVGLQMPKSRYRAMDRYFSRYGVSGAMMMRQTCTVQVCLDFGGSEHALARRYLAGQLMAPLATATFAYSPIVHLQKTPLKSNRSYTWRHLDPSRTGIVDLNQLLYKADKASCLAAYRSFLLNAQVAFVTGRDYEVPSGDLTFERWMNEGYYGIFPQLSDLETHLSLLFPEVRPRGFLELRSVDCQAPVWQSVPAAFYCGLLYDERVLEQVIDILAPEYASMPTRLLQAAKGLEEKEIAKPAKQIMELALEGFLRLPSCFRSKVAEKTALTYYHHFTERGRTPADDLIDAVEHEGEATNVVFAKLEQKWAKLLE